jgi:3,4-dihydroxy-2-butanone 4-phosphate synthase
VRHTSGLICAPMDPETADRQRLPLMVRDNEDPGSGAPADCVAVEDSASGIRSAHAAGITVLAIPNAATAQDFATLELAHHPAADARIAAKTLGTLAG